MFLFGESLLRAVLENLRAIASRPRGPLIERLWSLKRRATFVLADVALAQVVRIAGARLDLPLTRLLATVWMDAAQFLVRGRSSV